MLSHPSYFFFSCASLSLFVWLYILGWDCVKYYSGQYHISDRQESEPSFEKDGGIMTLELTLVQFKNVTCITKNALFLDFGDAFVIDFQDGFCSVKSVLQHTQRQPTDYS